MDFKQRIFQLHHQQRWTEVVVLCQQVQVKQDLDDDLSVVLIRGLRHSGQTQQALDYLEKFQSRLCNRPDFLLESAELAFQNRDFDKTKRQLLSLLPLATSSPRTAMRAGEILQSLGMPANAQKAYEIANQAQPGVNAIQLNLAKCYSQTGELERAAKLYQQLLHQQPQNQRLHFELARLKKWTDDSHLQAMESLLANPSLQGDQIFLRYAIGKEYEDLGDWSASYKHYQAGAKQAHIKCVQAGYSVQQDIALINLAKQHCSQNWLSQSRIFNVLPEPKTKPIFVVGLPRSGTTLLERILSNHSSIGTVDESFFIQQGIQNYQGGRPPTSLSATELNRAYNDNSDALAEYYLRHINYRVDAKWHYFVDKYPFNFLHLGLIKRAMPYAKLVVLQRDPMDSCFAMFKQPYFNFSFNQTELGQYFSAYQSLIEHWRETIDDLVVVQYEKLVTDSTVAINELFNQLGIAVEEQCFQPQRNPAPSSSASSTQIRSPIYTGSVGKWRRYEQYLQELQLIITDTGKYN